MQIEQTERGIIENSCGLHCTVIKEHLEIVEHFDNNNIMYTRSSINLYILVLTCKTKINKVYTYTQKCTLRDEKQQQKINPRGINYM